MKFNIIAMAAFACLLALAGLALSDETPTFGLVRQQYSGAVVNFIAGSGTNTAIEVVYTWDTPWRLTEVTSSAGTTTVYRVWNYERSVYQNNVETDLFGNTVTNRYMSGSVISVQTNEIFDTSSDTMPDTDVVVQGDMLIFDFGSETNIILRAAGSTP